MLTLFGPSLRGFNFPHLRPLSISSSRLSTIAATAASSSSSDELKLHEGVTAFWRKKLDELTKPAAVALKPSLSSANSLCFEINDMKNSLESSI